MIRFICKVCKAEAEIENSEIETSPLAVGYYAECPVCGAENIIHKKQKEVLDNFDEIEDWEEEIEEDFGLPKT